MLRYILRRILRAIPTIFVSVTLVFFIVRAMPSDPVALMISPQMSEETQQALIESYGLDKPLGTQYVLYMKELLKGNLGTSFAKRIPVTQYLAEKLPWTLLLLFVPVAGLIAAVIWAAGGTKSENRRNLARGFLLCCLLAALTGVLVCCGVGALLYRPYWFFGY